MYTKEDLGHELYHARENLVNAEKEHHDLDYVNVLVNESIALALIKIAQVLEDSLLSIRDNEFGNLEEMSNVGLIVNRLEDEEGNSLLEKIVKLLSK